MRILALLALPLCLLASHAHAQGYQVVPTCGQAKSATTGTAPGYMDQNGNVCTSGSVVITGPDGPEGGVSVSINPFRSDPDSHAGSMTVGGAWQQIAPANPLRQRFFIQNPCSAATQGIATTESLFLAFRPTMPTDSPLDVPFTELLTCGNFDTSSAVLGPSQAWVWAQTQGHRFQALEW